jgi:hypothetical protein
LKNRKPFIDAIIEGLAMICHTRRVAFVCTGGAWIEEGVCGGWGIVRKESFEGVRCGDEEKKEREKGRKKDEDRGRKKGENGG